MNWKYLKDKIYFSDGSLRDIFISDTTCSDWEKWVQYVNKNHHVEWYNSKTDKYETSIDFKIIQEFWHGIIDICPTSSIFIKEIQINVQFWGDSEIENDIDPEQINSLEDNLALITYMSEISDLLNKEVLLTPENYHEICLIRVNINNIEFA